MGCASRVDIDSCPEFFGPSPGAAGVVQVNVRSQEMVDMGWIKSEFSDARDHRVKDGLRAAVHQKQIPRPAFDQRNANDVRSSKVECVDQVNHPEN